MRMPIAIASLCLATPMAAETFTVTTTAGTGAGSLRQAIFDTSSSAGPHAIQFAIPGAGVHTISLLTPLPTISSYPGGLHISGGSVTARGNPFYGNGPVAISLGLNPPHAADPPFDV